MNATLLVATLVVLVFVWRTSPRAHGPAGDSGAEKAPAQVMVAANAPTN